MDYKTKIYYRNRVKELAKKTRVSEIYIAKKCLELANKNLSDDKENKKSHIGYYLLEAEGENELFDLLQYKSRSKRSNIFKMKLYIFAKKIISLIITLIIGTYVYSKTNSVLNFVISIILMYIPIEKVVVQIIQYILGKCIKPKLIPKIDFESICCVTSSVLIFKSIG